MEQFLVAQLARFGDVVQTGRLLQTLCQRGETHLCVDISLVPLAQTLYPKAHVHGLVVHRAPDATGFAHNAAILRLLASYPFNTVYLLNFSPLSAALARLFPPECVRGHRVERGQMRRDAWTALGFRLMRNRRAAPLNLVDFWAHLVDSPMPAEETHLPVCGGGRGIGVVLAGRESRRSLPMEILAPLAMTAFEACGGQRMVLLGSQTEQGMARHLLRLLPPKVSALVTDLSGRTDWHGLIEALRGLDAVLTPDTGTMHLAARLGVPVRAFFLSSAWCHETGPYGVGHHIWQTTAVCAPCLETSPCPCGTACLTAFAAPNLRRSLAFSLQGGTQGESLPSGMTRWRTAADALGIYCVAAAGEDDCAAERHACRAVLADKHGITLVNDQLTADVAMAAQRLYMEQDWMLPGGK